MPFSYPLVSTEWLAAQSANPGLVILDASMAAPGEALPDEVVCLPGARRFDMDKVICAPQSALPHTLPSAQQFQSQMRELGINNDSLVVVYDSKGIYSAPRAWWMFMCMGHRQVAVLDGGLPKWQREGRPLDNAHTATTQRGNFVAEFNPQALISAQQLLGESAPALIDARSAGRFAGSEPEPRAGLRSGHIPGALNLPFNRLVDNGCLLPTAQLQQQFDLLGVAPQQPLAFSCGSGVTACVPLLAAHLCGFKHLALYDGSWAEWGARPDWPIETGN